MSPTPPPAKPDLLMRYPPEENGFADGSGAAAYAVVYVRPETNTILYERAIVSGIRKRGDEIIYTANLNGSLFLRDRILEGHYVTQFRFAADPQGELSRYPPIADRIERHFGAPAARLPLVGAFTAGDRLGISAEELFETFVPPADFLNCWGQQFKKIGGAIVVNPSLPAVVSRHTTAANVFVVVVRSREDSPDFFASLNRAIFTEITSRSETPLVDGDMLASLEWSDKVSRTFHISRSHFMALLDMADFVYLSESERLEVARTPFGRSLLADGILSDRKLRELKENPLVRTRGVGSEELEYLPLAGEGQSLAWIRDLLHRL